MKDSNLRIAGSEPAALPTWLIPNGSWSVPGVSTHCTLSMRFSGGGGEIRTPSVYPVGPGLQPGSRPPS